MAPYKLPLQMTKEWWEEQHDRTNFLEEKGLEEDRIKFQEEKAAAGHTEGAVVAPAQATFQTVQTDDRLQAALQTRPDRHPTPQHRTPRCIPLNVAG
jgi:hypothetical protein